MAVTPVTVSRPDELWRAGQARAVLDGEANTVILRALEEYLATSRRRLAGKRPGTYRRLVTGLSPPVAAPHRSTRPAACLKALNIWYVYTLVAKAPTDLRMPGNFGKTSLREAEEKLAALGLALGMTLDRPSYADAVAAAVIANIRAVNG